MGVLLLFIIGFFLAKNLKSKENGETIKEVETLDGIGVVESLIKTLSTSTISSTTIPASVQALVISGQGKQIMENLKTIGIPILPILPISPTSIPQPGEVCETIEVKNVIKMPVFSKSTAKKVALGFIQTGQSIKIYACGKNREERVKRAYQLAREQGYIPLLV